MSKKLPDNIINCFNCIEDWREIEFKTLEYITGGEEKSFKEYYNSLYIEANNVLSNLRASRGKISKKSKKQVIRQRMHFKACMDINYGKSIGNAYIGIEEQHSTKNVLEGISYHFILTKKENDINIPLRVFHFDFITNDTKIHAPHPVYHLQYGGGLPSHLHEKIKEKDYNEKIDNWLESPRVFFTPFSLGLIINMLFIEFPNPINTKIIMTNGWINLMRNIEERLLEPYYVELNQFIERRKKDKKLIS